MNTYYATKQQEQLYLSKFESTTCQCDCGQSVVYIIENIDHKIIICDDCHESNDRRQQYDFCNKDIFNH